MRRREFIKVVAGLAVALPFAVRAQQPERMRRIGVLLGANADDVEFQTWVGSFLQGLQQAGWSIGQNVQIDTHWATSDAAGIRKHAAELAEVAPDVILATWNIDRSAIAAANSDGADCGAGVRRSGRRWLR